MELLLLLLLLLLASLFAQHGSLADQNNKNELEWEPLEKRHEIGEHEFLLCLATVPWCGESRSFMSDFLNVVKREGLAFPGLQLRYVNTHKDITFSAEKIPSLTLFRLGDAYKYAGKLSAEHVLASLKHAINTEPSDFPFKALQSEKQLQEFVDSTDRAFVLLDFCGWTKKKDEIIEDTEKEEWWQLSQVENMVGVMAARQGLDDDNTFTESHTMAKTSSKVRCIEEGLVQIQPQCLATDRIVFYAFYHNFTEIASAKFLIPGSARFGIITSLEVIEDARLVVACSKPWGLISQSQDLSRSWRMLTDADKLGAFIANSTVIVDEVDKDSEFLNSKPSVLLYINRGSYLPEVRGESIKALQIVREAARHYANLYPEHSEKSDNASDVVVGDSNYWVQPRGVSTLSSLLNKRSKGGTFAIQIQAHDKGELSEGIEGLLSAHAETILQLLLEGSDKSQNVDVVVDKGRDAEELESESLEARSTEGMNTASSGHEDAETVPVGDHKPSFRELRDEIRMNIELDSKENISEGQEVPLGSLVNLDNVAGNLGEKTRNEKQQMTAAQTGSIFFGFFDGESALKESLFGTNTSKPSVVLLFPERGAYYVYPTEVPLAFSRLVDFVDRALSGSLESTARSGPTPTPRREPVRPPFVNLNFHEVNSIPPVTVSTFSELVLGINNGQKSIIDNSLESTWNRDSVVMFTLPWCGFCKRMELVVREVHWYFTGYILPSANSCVESQRDGTSRQKIGKFEAPALFQMDCINNDCSHILGNISEEEAYPSLVLFPARNKHAPVVYDGAPTVNGIFQFIAAYRTSSTTFRGTPKGHIQPSSVQIQGNVASKTDTLLESMYPSVRQTAQSEMDITPVRIGVGDILLALDKLSDAPVFEKAAVLIISASPDYVMGLIVNKRLEWEQLPSLGTQLKNVRSAYVGHGGPIYEHPKHFYALTRLRDVEGFLEVYAGLFVAGPSATERVFELIEANQLPAGEFWFMAGHCGWSWHQLQQEIAAGYWHVTQYQESFFQWPAAKLNAVDNQP